MPAEIMPSAGQLHERVRDGVASRATRERTKPVAAGHLERSLLASDPDLAGGRAVTYAGWPLYSYVTDTAPEQANGQALNLNGGLWYVISPSGKVITKKP